MKLDLTDLFRRIGRGDITYRQAVREQGLDAVAIGVGHFMIVESDANGYFMGSIQKAIYLLYGGQFDSNTTKPNERKYISRFLHRHGFTYEPINRLPRWKVPDKVPQWQLEHADDRRSIGRVELPPEQPVRVSFACLYPGCHERFDSREKRDKHTRVYHGKEAESAASVMAASVTDDEDSGTATSSAETIQSSASTNIPRPEISSSERALISALEQLGGKAKRPLVTLTPMMGLSKRHISKLGNRLALRGLIKVSGHTKDRIWELVPYVSPPASPARKKRRKVVKVDDNATAAASATSGVGTDAIRAVDLHNGQVLVLFGDGSWQVAMLEGRSGAATIPHGSQS